MSNKPEPDRIAIFIEGCVAQVRASQEWFARRALASSLDQLRWRAYAGVWSILECLNHVNNTFEYYLPKIESAVRENPNSPAATISGVPFPESEEESLKLIEPVLGAKLAAQLAFPRFPAVDPDRIVNQYPQLRDRYHLALRSTQGLNLARIFIEKIFIEGCTHQPIQSLGGTLGLLAAYDRRYIWQAEQIMKAPGFPARL